MVVNYDWTAVIPQSNIQLNQWYGAGWVIMDPDSGSAGYMLAGSLVSGGELVTGGGSTSEPSNTEQLVVDIGVKAEVLYGLAVLAEAGGVFAYYGAIAIAGAVTAGGLIAGLAGAAAVLVGVGMVASAILLGYLFFRGYKDASIIRRKRWFVRNYPVIVAG